MTRKRDTNRKRRTRRRRYGCVIYTECRRFLVITSLIQHLNCIRYYELKSSMVKSWTADQPMRQCALKYVVSKDNLCKFQMNLRAHVQSISRQMTYAWVAQTRKANTSLFCSLVQQISPKLTGIKTRHSFILFMNYLRFWLSCIIFTFM